MLIMLHIQKVGYHLRCFEKIENISRNFLIHVAFHICLPWELSNRFATLGPAESFWRKLAARKRFISSFCLLVAASCLNTHARTSRVLFYLYNIQVPKEGRRNMRRLPFQAFVSHDVYSAAKSVLFHLTEPLDEKTYTCWQAARKEVGQEISKDNVAEFVGKVLPKNSIDERILFFISDIKKYKN